MSDKPSLYVVEKKEVIILVVLFVLVTWFPASDTYELRLHPVLFGGGVVQGACPVMAHHRHMSALGISRSVIERPHVGR